MCGRYLLLSPAEAMRRLFGLVGPVPNFPARFNVAPTDIMPVVRRAGAGHLEMVMLRWGLVPSWASDLSIGARTINARRESVATKPAFRDSFQRRRCIVPADGYYEWKEIDGVRQAYVIRPPDGELFSFAGVWESWVRPKEVSQGSPRDIGPAGEIVETYSIITGPALPSVANTHDRMPVVLAPSAFDPWLAPDTPAAALDDLMNPDHVEATVTPVGPRVNSVKNDDPHCLDPVEPKPRQASLF